MPRKNIAPFMGLPMLQWPIEAAKVSGLFHEIIVSTDDAEIAGIARLLNCEVHMRTPDDGSVGTQEIAGRVLDVRPEVDEACVIYPCSPMLKASDLVTACGGWRASKQQYAYSVLVPAQDAGCFYFGYAVAFKERMPLEGNAMRIRVNPARFIDINTPEDWSRAESMFNALNP